MEKILESLKNNNLDFNFSKNIFDKIKKELKSEIKDNKNLFLKANNVDNSIYMKQISLDKFFEIIDSYEFVESDNASFRTKEIVYNGNPYITLNLCMQALCEKTRIVLLYDDFMLGCNEVLIGTIKRVLNDYKFNDFVLNKEISDYKIIKKISEFVSNLVVIGKTGLFQNIDVNNKIFYPSNNVVLYCENERFYNIRRATYEYAMETKDEMEILYEDNIDEAIDIINMDKYANVAMLLTDNQESKNKFINGVKGKDIFVNENPFKSELIKIYNYLQ